MAAKNRAAQIERSLWAWRHQTLVPDIELIVVDDGSWDHEELRKHCHDYDARYEPITGNPDRMGPSIAWNHGLRSATGDVIALTHPEIIPDFDCARVILGGVLGDAALCEGIRLWTQQPEWFVRAADLQERAIRITVPVYRLQVQHDPELVSWQEDPRKLQNLPDFWDARTDFGGLTNRDIQGYQGFFWNNLFALHTQVWRWMNYLTPLQAWGIDDTDFQNRDKRLHLIYVHTIPEGPHGYHQWHPASFRGGFSNERSYNSEEEARLIELYPDTANQPCPFSQDLPPIYNE